MLYKMKWFKESYYWIFFFVWYLYLFKINGLIKIEKKYGSRNK